MHSLRRIVRDDVLRNTMSKTAAKRKLSPGNRSNGQVMSCPRQSSTVAQFCCCFFLYLEPYVLYALEPEICL